MGFDFRWCRRKEEKDMGKAGAGVGGCWWEKDWQEQEQRKPLRTCTPRSTDPIIAACPAFIQVTPTLRFAFPYYLTAHMTL